MFINFVNLKLYHEKYQKKENTRLKNFEKIPNFFTTLELQLQKSYLTQYL
jgi:hypothetical protein